MALNRGIFIALILVLGFFLIGSSARNETLYYAAPHFPPWDINPDENQSSGINADVIQEIANHLGLNFQAVPCPWKRCLSFLKEGRLDMAGTVGRKPEREAYLHFIEPTYAKIPDRVFYLPINSNAKLRHYDDLYQFNSIGVERGAKISPEFDQDTALLKDEVTRLDQLIKMFSMGRLDVVAGNEMVMDYMIKASGLDGKFRKAPFRFRSEGGEYLAISKKSPHARRLDEISLIVRKMKEGGQIQEYIDHYTKGQKELKISRSGLHQSTEF